MPLFKKPQTLHAITVVSIKELLINTCVTIRSRFGSYDNESCRDQVNMVQGYFVKIIGIFLDDFCTGSPIRFSITSNTIDGRILLGIFLYNGTKTILHLDEDELYNCWRSCRSHYAAKIRNIKTFFLEKLRDMPNVVKLDLSYVRDAHELFETVGTNCNRVEELTLDSRSNITPTNEEHLMYLTSCSKLRVIFDLGQLKTYKRPSLRRFIKLMPQLTYISVRNLGDILSTDMEDLTTPLSLNHAYERHMTPEYIHSFTKHCPHLRSLHLIKSDKPQETLVALSESGFQLTHLILDRFPLDCGMINVLQKKGELLTSLDLRLSVIHATQFISNLDVIQIIGKLCPNLAHLRLRSDCMNSQNGAKVDGVLDPDIRMFRKLETLDLYNAVLLTEGVLSLFLKHAFRITKISLYDIQTSDWKFIGDELVNLKNPMTELKLLKLQCTYVRLKPGDITSLYNRFSYVKSIFVNVSFISKQSRNEVGKIQDSILDNNYDVCFNVSWM